MSIVTHRHDPLPAPLATTMRSCADCHSLYLTSERCLCETPLQRLAGSVRAVLGWSAR